MSSGAEWPKTVAFIGFGEAARSFVGSLRAAGHDFRCLAYDLLIDGSEMRAALAEHDVESIADPEVLKRADWVFSAVTADQSANACVWAVSGLHEGQVFIDINSVSPNQKRENAATVEARGAIYADLAVMAPVQPRGHATPCLLATRHPDLLAALAALGFDLRMVSEQAGDATAIKMVRSLFVKGLEAITVETLLAAEASGCLDEIQSSLAKSFAGLGWPEFAGYEFERTLRHGTRRAAEMRESARTIADLGLNGRLADAIADTQAEMGKAGQRIDMSTPLPDLIAAVLKARLAERG